MINEKGSKTSLNLRSRSYIKKDKNTCCSRMKRRFTRKKLKDKSKEPRTTQAQPVVVKVNSPATNLKSM